VCAVAGIDIDGRQAARIEGCIGPEVGFRQASEKEIANARVWSARALEMGGDWPYWITLPVEGVLESSMPLKVAVACQIVPVVFVPK
jgi:hypothetical protein